MNDIIRSQPFIDAEHKIFECCIESAGNLGLASGSAGVLLAVTYHYQIAPSKHRGDYVAAVLQSMIDHIPDAPLGVDLWSGIAGVAFAFEMTKKLPSPPWAEAARPIEEFLEMLDDQLIGFLTGTPVHHFDLISGVVGVGAYALAKRDREVAKKIYAAVEDVLVTYIDTRDSSYRWLTKPQYVASGWSDDNKQRGRLDLGVAHGTPGVIGMLAWAMLKGIHTPRTAAMLKGACAFMKSLHQSEAVNSAYAYSLSADSCGEERTSRVAWCYGDLGVASVFSLAGSALKNRDLISYAGSLTERRLGQPRQNWGLDSFGLCHGKAGIVHLLNRLAGALPAETPLVSTEMTLWRELADELASAQIGADNYGLLNGWAGALLALNKHHSSEVESVQWNLCLLTP